MLQSIENDEYLQSCISCPRNAMAFFEQIEQPLCAELLVTLVTAKPIR